MPAARTREARLTLAQAAQVLGVTEQFALALTLSGARRPSDQGGEVVELDYAVDDEEVVFTRPGIERFLRRCPVGDLVTAAVAADRLGIHRSQVSTLVYTGIPAGDGGVVRLPVWGIGGGDHVAKADLEVFAGHHKSWLERKAARELKKRYTRPAKPAPDA